MLSLVLYSKPGCHLCEGLQEKLEAITGLEFQVEIRDITQQTTWYEAYQFEVPVLKSVCRSTGNERLVPRPSPRLTVTQLEQHLRKALIEQSG